MQHCLELERAYGALVMKMNIRHQVAEYSLRKLYEDAEGIILKCKHLLANSNTPHEQDIIREIMYLSESRILRLLEGIES